jgi:hypothetical protein
MTRYEQIIEWIFRKNYQPGEVIVRFNRDELVHASSDLGFARIKNLGDIPYSFRFRRELPETIQSTAPKDAEWIIVGMGEPILYCRVRRSRPVIDLVLFK